MDEAFIKKEREKARLLRKSRWWQNKIAHAVCYYCQKKITAKEATMDHIVPMSRGGTSTRGNVVVCCKACNNEKKSNIPVEAFLE